MIYNFSFWVLGYILLSVVIGLVSYFVARSHYLANSYRFYPAIITSLVMACYFGVQLIGCGTFYLNIMFPVVSAMTVLNGLIVTDALMLIIRLLLMFYFKKQSKHILDKIDNILRKSGEKKC